MIRLSASLLALCLTSFPAMAEETVASGHKLAAAAEHAEGAKGGLPQFDPTWFASQIFWLLAFFAFLYFFFAKKTLPDISSVIETRKNKISADLQSAETLTAQAQSVQTTYESGLQKARESAGKAVADVESAMAAKASQQNEAFRKHAETEIGAAETRILAAKDVAMKDRSVIAAEVASEAVKKIIGVGTDINQAKAIIQTLSDKAKAA